MPCSETLTSFGITLLNLHIWIAKANDLFFAAGMYGQIIMVMPSHNAVAVSMGFSLNQNIVPAEMYKGFCKAKVFENCSTTSPAIV